MTPTGSSMGAMITLASCILLGFVIQWIFTLPKTWDVLRQGKIHRQGSLFSIPQEVRSLSKATLFGMVGVAAMQINSFLDMLFAKYADSKGPIYLWYAIRLEQLPLAIIGFACVYSLTPSITRAIKASNHDSAYSLFNLATIESSYLSFPVCLPFLLLDFLQ